MADVNAQTEILEIEDKLKSGATRISTDGLNVALSQDALRARLRDARIRDNSVRRPVKTSINLSACF